MSRSKALSAGRVTRRRPYESTVRTGWACRKPASSAASRTLPGSSRLRGRPARCSTVDALRAVELRSGGGHGLEAIEGGGRVDLAVQRAAALELEQGAIGDRVTVHRVRGPGDPPVYDPDAQPLLGRHVPERLGAAQHG